MINLKYKQTEMVMARKENCKPQPTGRMWNGCGRRWAVMGVAERKFVENA